MKKKVKKHDFEILKSGFKIDFQIYKLILKPDFKIVFFFLFFIFCFCFASGAAISKNCRFLATSSAQGTVFIRALPDGHVIKIIQAHSAEIFALAFSANNSLFCTGGCDFDVRIWDTRNWSCVHFHSS